jgi:ABC-type glutathione transport system ATPase component
MSSPPIISVQNATVRYRGAVTPAMVDVSLDVNVGEAIGIAGESGCGKTTLARAILGQLQPSDGEILVNGVPWSTVGRKSPHRTAVQMIFQDPYAALNPRLSPLAAVAEVFRVTAGAGRADSRTRATQILDRVGLAGRMIDRMPHDLSGGQRQRVVIARALACNPRLIVADEPTSALDVSVQAQILNLLLDLREEQGVALILVTHDLEVLKHMTDSALVMQDGRIVERGPTAQLLEQPSHPFTRKLVDARSHRVRTNDPSISNV